MQRLVTLLDSRNDLVIHQQVDQSYYMQKIEELKILLSQLEVAGQNVDALASRIDSHYTLCSTQWYKDVRWLHEKRLRELGRPIL